MPVITKPVSQIILAFEAKPPFAAISMNARNGPFLIGCRDREVRDLGGQRTTGARGSKVFPRVSNGAGVIPDSMVRRIAGADTIWQRPEPAASPES